MLKIMPKPAQDVAPDNGITDGVAHSGWAQPAIGSAGAGSHHAMGGARDALERSVENTPYKSVADLGTVSGLDRQEQIAAICDGMIDIVAVLFNVSGRELRSPRRSSKPVSRVRQIAMYLAHVALELSMRDVGRGFGRDRTTVLYACHQIEDMREDKEFDQIVGRVEQIVRVAFGVRARRG